MHLSSNAFIHWQVTSKMCAGVRGLAAAQGGPGHQRQGGQEGDGGGRPHRHQGQKGGGHFESKLQLEKTLLIFSQIEVGDIILINDGEEFPADVSPQNLEAFLVHKAVLFLSISQMVILSSSSPQGKANIMTANLG